MTLLQGKYVEEPAHDTLDCDIEMVQPRVVTVTVSEPPREENKQQEHHCVKEKEIFAQQLNELAGIRN